MADNVWCGNTGNKLYHQSGFTSTLKTSISTTSEDSSPSDISYDGTNTFWAGNTFDKFWIWSGVFSTTLIDSQPHTDYANVGHCSSDNDNTPWGGNDLATGSKLFLYSGKLTNTLKDSQEVHTIDTGLNGMSWDGTNTPWCGLIDDKLYLQSGQFTSTLKTSLDVFAINANGTGISWDGTDTVWCGNTGDKLYLQSGQFTSTIKESVDVNSVDTVCAGVESMAFTERVSGAVDVTVTPAALALSAAAVAPTINIRIDVTVVIGSALSLSLATSEPMIPQAGFAFPATLSMGLALGAPSIVVDNVQAPATLTLGLTLQAPTIDIFEPDVTVFPATLSLGLTAETVTVLVDVVLLLPGQPMPPVNAFLSLHAPTVVITNDIKTIVTNTRNFAISEYAAFAYNSMCKFNGKYLYARANGIYEGGGDDDDGSQIAASYKSGATNIFVTEIQKLRDAYMNFRSDGDIQLFSVGDEVNTRWYTIVNSTINTIHERRVKFPRGIRERNFNFGVSNINGSTFEIDSIKILTEPVRKRR